MPRSASRSRADSTLGLAHFDCDLVTFRVWCLEEGLLGRPPAKENPLELELRKLRQFLEER